MTPREQELEFQMRGLLKMMRAVQPALDALPERKRRTVPGLNSWPQVIAVAQAVLDGTPLPVPPSDGGDDILTF